MAQTQPPTELEPPKAERQTVPWKKKLPLPHHRPTALFILAMAGHFVRDKMHAAQAYEIETLTQEVEGLSGTSRDVGNAALRQLAGRKRLYKRLDDVPDEKLHIRRPSFPVLAMVIGLSTLTILVYGNYYNPALGAAAVNFWNANYLYLMTMIFVVIFGLIYMGATKRRKSKGGK